jgi:hypothetical protein
LLRGSTKLLRHNGETDPVYMKKLRLEGSLETGNKFLDLALIKGEECLSRATRSDVKPRKLQVAEGPGFYYDV